MCGNSEDTWDSARSDTARVASAREPEWWRREADRAIAREPVWGGKNAGC